ncbi:MAG: hypothetical protein RL497_1093 [Pseudomonadota bacterium]|jgi:hypothetical protein
MKNIIINTLIGALILIGSPHLIAENTAPQKTALEILQSSDRARGGGLPGIEWTLDMTTLEPGADTLHEIMTVNALDDFSLATRVFPKRIAGGKLLQVRKNMWYAKPGLRKPISISPRQKLSGPAANGDIAATNYALEYDAELTGMEDINGTSTYVLSLTAKNNWVTYDKIKYWVSTTGLVPVRAEFYTVSGKLFKYATFENNNKIEYQGISIPFVSKIEIVDAIKKGASSTLLYSEIKTKALSALDFSPSVMMN